MCVLGQLQCITVSPFISQSFPTYFPTCQQVHTFYEAVGYMISAQTDPQMQEALIDKYMALPNQVIIVK